MNLAKLDLISIRLVVLCEQMGSLSMAAQEANMSKSRASHRLASLESKLGMQLFVRDHRGLHITDAGSMVAGRGRSILHEIKQLSQQLKSFDDTPNASTRNAFSD
jgi:DNA-binding transcriptional LysR family regulator